jgi:hypothetical protein
VLAEGNDVSDNCPTCGRSFPTELEWRYVRQLDNGKWEARVQLGPWAGWAMQKTEEQARQKALARLHYAKEFL